MYKIKLLLTVVALTILPSLIKAQNNNTQSPYSRYGYGVLSDQSFGAQRGMGGIGYGLRNPQMINPLNPASYSVVDSMTFMLDFGIKGQMVWLKEGKNEAKKYDAALEYVALQFPLAPRLGLGVGLEPISYVGYRFANEPASFEGIDGEYYQTFSGTGGLNSVYANLSYSVLDQLSVGVKLGYLFGDVIHDRAVSFSTSNTYISTWGDTLRSSGLLYGLGVQYSYPLKKNEGLVIGAVYHPKTRINGHVMNGVNRYNPSTNQLESSEHTVLKDLAFHMPETYGLGVTYRKMNRLTLGVDAKYQRWADVAFFNQTDSLANRLKINAGVEYIPNVLGSNVFKRSRYRAGAYYSNSYIKTANGHGYDEFGASIGMGIPMVDRRSFINWALEYSVVCPQVPMIDEQYFRFTLSYTFNELWFYKRKLQ
jgi:hypothetical protein